MRKVKKKALVLSMALAAGLLVPVTMNAQDYDGSRGLFGRGFAAEDAASNNRDGGIGLGGAESEDPTSPLGSGILVLVAAGAGYAALKRKEDKQ